MGEGSWTLQNISSSLYLGSGVGTPREAPDVCGWFPAASCERTWGWGETCRSGPLSDKLPPLSPQVWKACSAWGWERDLPLGPPHPPPLSSTLCQQPENLPSQIWILLSILVGSQFSLAGDCSATLLPPASPLPRQLHLLWADSLVQPQGSLLPPPHCSSSLCE